MLMRGIPRMKLLIIVVVLIRGCVYRGRPVNASVKTVEGGGGIRAPGALGNVVLFS